MSIQTIKKTLLASALLGSALPHAFVTLAEETSADRVFEEVVVTARKRQEGAQSVPIPISAISAEQLETRNLTEIRDIEKLSPNTDIDFSPSNGTSANIFMRGIGQVNWSGTQDPKIGIYVDGVYLSRAQGALVDFNDVERVEVLRGPQGTLFGRNTTAGLVHIINKRPTAESFESDITLGVGNDGQRKWGLMLNTPLSDQISARLSVSGQQADGVTINSVTGNDRGNEDSQSARLALRWQNDSMDALLTYSRFEADERGALATCDWYAPSDPFAGLARGGLPAVAVIFGTYNQMQANCEGTTKDVSIDTTNDERATVDVDSLVLNVSYDFGPMTVTSITAQRELEYFNGSWGWVMGNGPGSNFLEILNNPGGTEAFSQELRLSGSTERLDWVLGAYWFEEDTLESLDVPLFRGVLPPDPAVWPFFYAPDGAGGTLGAAALGAQIYGSRNQTHDVTNENEAFFAELTYAITDQWDVTLGARYTSDDRDFTRVQTLVGGAFDPFYFCPGMPTVELAPGVLASASDRCRQTVSYSKTTPRVIVSYQHSSDLMLYGSYSMGYASGGFNQDVRMRSFEPEVAHNFEFGIKSDLLDGRLRLNATLFNNEYKNQQLTVGRLVNGQPTADLINAQQASLSGVEFEVLGRLSDELTLTLSVGYLKGEYDEFTVIDNVTVVAEDGSLSSVETERDLSYIEFGSKGKNLSMDIGLLHNMNIGGAGEIVSSVGATFKDDRYYSLENTPSSFQPSYWLVDGRITWFLSNGQSSVSLWGNNLTDKDYVTSMIDQAGTIQIGGADPSLGMAASYWGEPRRFGLEFRHSF